MLILIPRDPWPVGLFIYLFFCSIVGSSLAQIIGKEFAKKLTFSICITAVLFGIGVLISDLNKEGREIFSEYATWMPLLILIIVLDATASTLTTFPIVSFIMGLCKKSPNKSL